MFPIFHACVQYITLEGIRLGDCCWVHNLRSEFTFISTDPGESDSSQRAGVDPQTSLQGAPLTTGDISTSSDPLQDNHRVSPSVNYK